MKASIRRILHIYYRNRILLFGISGVHKVTSDDCHSLTFPVVAITSCVRSALLEKNGQKLKKNSNLPNLCRECSGRLRQQVFYLLSFLHIDQLKQKISIRGYITFILLNKTYISRTVHKLIETFKPTYQET